jgi:hypothetical protein
MPSALVMDFTMWTGVCPPQRTDIYAVRAVCRSAKFPPVPDITNRGSALAHQPPPNTPFHPSRPQHLAIARKASSLATMTQKQSRKRPKSWRGCTICRAARRKCTEEHPRCAHCERNKLDCQVPPHCAPWAGGACGSVELMVVRLGCCVSGGGVCC